MSYFPRSRRREEAEFPRLLSLSSSTWLIIFASRLLVALACLLAASSFTAAIAQPKPPEQDRNQSSVFLESNIDRPLRYWPEGRDFVITNGGEFFNRPLYSANTAFRVDAGDQPEFSLYLPGRGGNLRFGVQTAAGTKWLHEMETVVARYRAGSMYYEIRDPTIIGPRELKLTVLPLRRTKGVSVRAELNSAWLAQCDLLWAFGGANGMRGRRSGDIGCEREPVSQFFQLRPEQCRDDKFTRATNSFTLQGKSATIAGFVSSHATLALVNAEHWTNLPALLASTNQSPALPILLGRAAIQHEQPIFISLQQIETNTIPLTAAELPTLFAQAESDRRAIADRVLVETPDPFINAAAAALNIAADAVWDAKQTSFMHGAVAWRNRLLGWRGQYAGDALGWHDRTRQHIAGFAKEQNLNPIPETIPPVDEDTNLARSRKAIHSNGNLTKNHYDMNLVAVDAFFRHLLWTGDLNFARELWPMLERHFAWERRLFRREFGPDKLPLYEGYAAIWASDDLTYNGGGAAHASAYNFYHNKMAARVAKLIGKDPQPYERESELIAKAMRRELWLPEQGWFAEYKDYLGLQRVHPSAALWTYYHTIDSEVPTAEEAWRMTGGLDTQFPRIPILFTSGNRREEAQTNSLSPSDGKESEVRTRQNNLPIQPQSRSAPVSGAALRESRLASDSSLNVAESWIAAPEDGRTPSRFMGIGSRETEPTGHTLSTSTWMPYSWSINNVVMAEAMHTSLAYWQANRPDGAFPLFKGAALDSMFLGLCPGNVGMCTYFDTYRRESQRDFADGIGATARALIEGLFGVKPDTLVGELTIRPGFPRDWNHASLRHPDVNFSFHRDDLKETFIVEQRFTKPMALRLLISRHHEIASLTMNGEPAQSTKSNLPGESRLEIAASPAARHEIVVMWRGNILPPSHPPKGGEGWGEEARLSSTNYFNWHTPIPATARLETIDLTAHFNDRVSQIFSNDYRAPRSPFASLATPKQGLGSWCHPFDHFTVDDSGLRAAARANSGILLLPNGVPFATPTAPDSPNILFTSQWTNYPTTATVPLTGKAQHAFLLMAGSTSHMQSRLDNGEIFITYTDDSSERLSLHNPTTWWPIEQDYYLDDFAFRRPEPIPPRVDLKTGRVRLLDVKTFKGRGKEVPGGAATVLELPLNPTKELKSLTLHALANEVVIGLMAITLERE
jgi:hypothetical protein